MSLARQYDIGKYIKGVAAIAPATVLSSAGGSATNGLTIDRNALPRHCYSARAIVTGRLTGSTQQTVSLASAVQHSSDGSSWDSFSTGTNASAVVGSTGATGAQSTDGTVEQTINLKSARRYIRVNVTPTFTLTSSGDNVALNGVVAFGGADELPSS